MDCWHFNLQHTDKTEVWETIYASTKDSAVDYVQRLWPNSCILLSYKEERKYDWEARLARLEEAKFDKR